ncbi:MAG TPA: hypothetical protein ENK47_03955 [Euryarchaeota archaeon]|nr:hypothetical protein [Euryarchaeota archaeon]
MECKRGKSEGRKKVEALFRKRVRKVYRGDSYVLIPVEDLVRNLYYSLTVDGEPREPIFTENLFKAALVDPEVPGQLLLSMKAYRKGTDMVDELLKALGSMKEMEIVSKAFTLWMKRRKDADVRRSFQQFSDDLASRLSVSMKGEPLSDLDYLLSLEPTPIRMLDYRLISDKALEWVSEGIRFFDQGKRMEAISRIEMSISAIPGNPTAHWNLARLNYIEGRRSDSIKMMDRTIELLSDRSLVKEARREQEMMRKGSLDVNGIVPRDHIRV